MTREEKLLKVTHDFSLLPEDKQDYVLGILHALVFARDTADVQAVPLDTEQNTE